MIGANDETALRQGIKFNYPKFTNILCIRHIKQNVDDSTYQFFLDDFLQNKIGLQDKQRQKWTKNILNLATADDSFIFDERDQTQAIFQVRDPHLLCIYK